MNPDYGFPVREALRVSRIPGVSAQTRDALVARAQQWRNDHHLNPSTGAARSDANALLYYAHRVEGAMQDARDAAERAQRDQEEQQRRQEDERRRQEDERRRQEEEKRRQEDDQRLQDEQRRNQTNNTMIRIRYILPDITSPDTQTQVQDHLNQLEGMNLTSREASLYAIETENIARGGLPVDYVDLR